MNVSIIVAQAENRAIGKDNDLIWHLPKDLKHFSKTTMGHHVLMGRKNFESIPHKYRPLSGRTNVVITRNKSYQAQDCPVVFSLEAALEFAKINGEEEVFVIGGGQIYKEALDLGVVNKLYLTVVHESFEADVFFPEIDLSSWIKTNERYYPIHDRHDYAFSVFTYVKG